jgi:biopolymer transport protein ExbD
MAKKTTSLGAVADINVTPMVDVMLVLLIIFMVITPMLHKGVNVDLVTAQNSHDMQEADKEDAALISITRDGKVYLKSDPIDPDQLAPKLKDMLADKLNKTVYLRSDYRAKYSVVVNVVDNIRAAGVDSLGLLTEKRSGGATPPPPPPSTTATPTS